MTISDKIAEIKNGQSKLDEGSQGESKKSIYVRIMENLENWVTKGQKSAVVYPDKFFGNNVLQFDWNSISSMDRMSLTQKEQELCTYLEKTEGLSLLVASFGQDHVIIIGL